MSSGQVLPYPTKASDFEYLARQRRTAWLGLHAAAGAMLKATDDTARARARSRLHTYYWRIEALKASAAEVPS